MGFFQSARPRNTPRPKQLKLDPTMSNTTKCSTDILKFSPSESADYRDRTHRQRVSFSPFLFTFVVQTSS